jgi:hypothetical protein
MMGGISYDERVRVHKAAQLRYPNMLSYDEHTYWGALIDTMALDRMTHGMMNISVGRFYRWCVAYRATRGMMNMSIGER